MRRSEQARLGPEEQLGCPVGRCPDLSALSGVDRSQVLLSQTARFAASYLRWLDANSGGGLTFHRLMLIRYLGCGGPAIMSELAAALGVSARNMTAIVDGLEREHLVVRRPHPTDRRATLVELTSDGSATVDTSLGPGIEALGKLFEGLDPEEQRRFLLTIDRLMGAMECTLEPSAQVPRTIRRSCGGPDGDGDQGPASTNPFQR